MDLVYLRLQPSCQISLGLKKHNKLFDLFYGPFDIIENMGSLVYRLKLSRDYTIHDVFHESLLKAKLQSSMWSVLFLKLFILIQQQQWDINPRSVSSNAKFNGQDQMLEKLLRKSSVSCNGIVLHFLSPLCTKHIFRDEVFTRVGV